METRRYLTFFIVMFTFYIGWVSFGPKLFPSLFPKPKQQQGKKIDEGEKEEIANKQPSKKDGENKPDKKNETLAGFTKKELLAKLVEKSDEIQLGSLKANSGYYMLATVSTRGALLNKVELNDPRYKELKSELPIKVIGNLTGMRPHQTFGLTVKRFNQQVVERAPEFKGSDWLNSVVWKIVPNSQTESSVSFRTFSPDKIIEVTKTFALKKFKNPQEAESREMRDSTISGYQMNVTIAFRNLGKEEQKVQYILQGPVGLPLENKEHTREFRTAKWGLVEEDGDLYSSSITAKSIVSQAEDDKIEELRKPIGYIGIDVQYFAALISPLDKRSSKERVAAPWFESAKPQLIKQEKTETHSDISVQLTSTPLTIPADGEPVSHSFALFTGPKRKQLLASAPFHAEESLDLGWFSAISKGMLAILKFFHNTMSFHYAFAIISLTVLVRSLMFPLSRKQAAGAQKMKEFQPKLAALKEKYGDDKEKMARAQMELFRKHGYNPLGGCLPMFIQLPIFIGLYRMLNTAVDLRRVGFLWFDNLAAPDELFHMRFSLPFLGSDFNLLPILTVILFYAQQKMFMPPATTPEQAQQQKMMSFMMFFMGFMFYHVPAGLCLYFIASSGWGLAERKLLAIWDEKHPKPKMSDDDASSASGGKGKNEEPKEKGFFGRLIDIADQAANESKAKQAKEKNGQPNQNKNSKSRKKKKR